MDVRREANRAGLTIRGTQKIWNSSLAGIGLLYAKRHGVLRPYNDEVFARFWKRDLDIEDAAALADVLGRTGADGAGFADFAEREGREELRRCRPPPRSRGCSGCRASCSPTAISIGAASTCRASASGWPNMLARGYFDTFSSFAFGRIASAVPWMKAWIFTTSASESLPVKSGMPCALNGPLNTMLLRLRIVSAPT